MRRWREAAGPALAFVSERPWLWLPGALAWVASVGWIPFVLAVARFPTQSEMTYWGAGMRTSGWWPLNLVLLAGGLILVVILALGMVAVANAALLATAEGREEDGGDARRLFLASLMAVPAVALAVLIVLVATVAVAPAEFNRPQGQPGPVVRTTARLAPLLALAFAIIASSSGLSGLVGRAAVAYRSIGAGLVLVPRLLARGGLAAVVHVIVASLVGISLLVLSSLLLRVLWEPIEASLAAGEPLDAPTALLLVGFVAIWLCLVLGGGAAHAWSSVTWSRLLGATRSSEAGARKPAWKS